jgi:hypothetical protein
MSRALVPDELGGDPLGPQRREPLLRLPDGAGLIILVVDDEGRGAEVRGVGDR